MESRETELYNKLYKNQKRTTNIFGFLNFETRTEGNSKQSKIFLDFLNIKPKMSYDYQSSFIIHELPTWQAFTDKVSYDYQSS
jgi:hypothetical protein